MRKLNEVLRLRFELGLGQRAIARACSISQGAVHNYLKKAAAAGFGWPLPEGWDEKRIEEALFGNRRPIERRPRALPDFPALREQFQRHPHLTLQLAWEQYRQAHPEGYGYSRFCELYQRWRKKQDVVLRQEHKPGEKGFVDWAGATIPVHDPVSDEIWPASLFMMVLGAKSYCSEKRSFSAGNSSSTRKRPRPMLRASAPALTVGSWQESPALAQRESRIARNCASGAWRCRWRPRPNSELLSRLSRRLLTSPTF